MPEILTYNFETLRAYYKGFILRDALLDASIDTNILLVLCINGLLLLEDTNRIFVGGEEAAKESFSMPKNPINSAPAHLGSVGRP